ncbi:hypothetical protein VBD025_00430 [Virgibacillus flavescens]|uniref:hypothetical protein n=1 Tax=Virgibacillus flavescens TaxID=1611422 RepID=UPI003D32B2DD
MLWNSLSDEKFGDQLTSRVKDRKEIQAAFQLFIQSHQKKPLVTSNVGKIVIHADKLLRFPRNILSDFDASKTMIISAGINTLRDKKTTLISNKKRKKVRALTTIQIVTKKNVKQKAENTKRHNSIPVISLNDYTSNTEKSVKQLQNKARAIFKSHKNHPLYTNTNFQNIFLDNISEIIKRIEQCKSFLNRVPVSCIVVSTTHSYISRIISIVASERGIPTICMQHGIISAEFGYLPKIATIDAVYGNFEVDWYKKLGASMDSLEVIGHPRFDQAFHRPKINRSKFERHLGLDRNKKTLMVVIRNNQDVNRWRTLIKTISEKVNVNILIKNYPSKLPHSLTNEFPFAYSTKNYDLYDIIPNVDCVVAYSSTVGLEVMLAGKPLFILNETFPGYTGYYDGLEGMVHADPHKLGKLIIKYFINPKWKNYAETKRIKFLSHAYPDFSMSGERLKKLINRLTS